MKLKSLFLTIFMLLVMASTALATDIYTGPTFIYDRPNHSGYSLTGSSKEDLDKNDVPSISTNLVTTLDGYKFYVDIPEWMVKEHTTNKVKNDGPLLSFDYQVKEPYQGLSINIFKNFFPDNYRANMIQRIMATTPPAGTVINNKVYTEKDRLNHLIQELDQNMIYEKTFPTLVLAGDDIISTTYSRVYFEDRSALLSTDKVVAKPKNLKTLTNSMALMYVEGNDLVIISMNYGQKSTAAEEQDMMKALLTAKIVKA